MNERRYVRQKSTAGRYWFCGLVLAGLAMAPSCGGSSTNTHGGETHWLGLCSASSPCDDRFDCLCGVCTQECESNADCSSLGATAVCARGAATDLGDSCGNDATRRICVRESQVGGSTSSGGTGGTSGSTGGAGQAGGGSGGDAGECAAQDASGVKTGDCEERAFVYWNGEACATKWGCCEGAGCAELSSTLEECAKDHASCFDNQVCSDERREAREILNESKSCTDASDCRSYVVGCGVTEDGCTGAVYSNGELAVSEVERLTARLNTCMAAFEDSGSCGVCERLAAPPACVDGRCVAESDGCALERSALRWFLDENKACQSDGDCTVETVGCGVSEDGCTGAVYLAEGFDRDEFETLMAELHACPALDESSCMLCERETTPVACVEGRCRPAP